MGDIQMQVPIKWGHDFLLKIFKYFFSCFPMEFQNVNFGFNF